MTIFDQQGNLAGSAVRQRAKETLSSALSSFAPVNEMGLVLAICLLRILAPHQAIQVLKTALEEIQRRTR